MYASALSPIPKPPGVFCSGRCKALSLLRLCHGLCGLDLPILNRHDRHRIALPLQKLSASSSSSSQPYTHRFVVLGTASWQTGSMEPAGVSQPVRHLFEWIAAAQTSLQAATL